MGEATQGALNLDREHSKQKGASGLIPIDTLISKHITADGGTTRKRDFCIERGGMT